MILSIKIFLNVSTFKMQIIKSQQKFKIKILLIILKLKIQIMFKDKNQFNKLNNNKTPSL